MKIAIAVLAAGRSTRMRGTNKLLQSLDGEPLVRRSVRAALSTARKDIDVMVVTGSLSAEIRDALPGLPVSFIHNPDFATGIASSIRVAVANLPEETAGLMIHLADMPDVTGNDLASLIETFVDNQGRVVVQARHGGRPGNPAILPRHLYPQIGRLEGDTGARRLILEASAVGVEIGSGALLDIDTPEDLSAYFHRRPVRAER